MNREMAVTQDKPLPKIFLKIKPLSVNEAWQGQRFKTDKYKNYEKAVLLMLPKNTVPTGVKLSINIKFGFSSSNSDLDNPVKLVVDLMQKKYGFNDAQVYEMNLKKEIVKKGNEYIYFEIIKI